MDLLSAHDLIRLADERGGTRVSLFLPTHRGGPRTDRNRIRLKNLLATARRALLAEGGRAGEVDAVLEPAQQFLDEMRSWEQPRDGLALFLGPSGLRHFSVPLRLPELVTVGDRFVAQPLLPLLTAGGRFYVIALSQDEIRLFEGTRFSLDELALEGLPLAMWLTMPRRRPQVHAFLSDRGGTGGRTVFHGSDHAGPKMLVLQHFQRVDQALREVLSGGRAPLVLAGVRSMQALYRKANTYPELLAAGLDGSPRDISTEELHRRAWPLVEPVLRRDEAVAASAHRALQGTGRTCSEPAEVLTAAQQGRVEALFLSTDAPEWRSGADAESLIRLGNPLREGEQVDLAAIATLRHAGGVYAVPAVHMPGGDPVAATLRY
jgi:hypothetical protein